MLGSATFASNVVRGFPRGHSERCDMRGLHWEVWKERSVSYCTAERDKVAHGGKTEETELGGRGLCRRKSGVRLGSSEEKPQELRGNAGSLRAVERASADSWKRETSVWRETTPSAGLAGRLQGAHKSSLRKMTSSRHLPGQEKTDLVLLTVKRDFLCPHSSLLPLLTIKPRALNQARDPSEGGALCNCPGHARCCCCWP